MKILQYIIDYITALLATILLLCAALAALALAVPLTPILALAVAAWPYFEEQYNEEKEMKENGATD